MEEQNVPVSPRRRMPRLPKRMMLVIGIIIILAVLAAAFFGGRMSVYKAHPELESTEQAEAILEKVAKLIKLPEGEMPSMATIEEAESVKAEQPFLANAEDGDILIVYPAAATALLYRPSTNILIAVGPVDTSDQATAPQQEETIDTDVEAGEGDETSTSTDAETAE